MSATGRFFVLVGGRKFCVEPLHERGGARDGGWGNASARERGSIAPEESIITPENGYTNLPARPGRWWRVIA